MGLHHGERWRVVKSRGKGTLIARAAPGERTEAVTAESLVVNPGAVVVMTALESPRTAEDRRGFGEEAADEEVERDDEIAETGDEKIEPADVVSVVAEVATVEVVVTTGEDLRVVVGAGGKEIRRLNLGLG